MTRTWVNVFTAVYDKEEIQLSTPYATKEDAIRGVRPSMKSRYKTTINLAELLVKALEPKEMPVFANTPEVNEFLHQINNKFNEIIYRNNVRHSQQF